MCGGVIFPYKPAYDEVLAAYYSPAEVEAFKKSGQVRSLYWQRSEPVLPVVVPTAEGESQVAELMRWGNRDKDAPFPQTGWARVDSIEAGKWAYLKPVPAVIPVSYGVEKGKWFEIEHGIKGLVVQRGNERRIYMLTEEADPDYVSVTKHNRKPILEGQADFPWLPGEPPGMEYAQNKGLNK